ncbi:unnamed protein product, partial [Musa acuminata subsp. burmannicoides]
AKGVLLLHLPYGSPLERMTSDLLHPRIGSMSSRIYNLPWSPEVKPRRIPSVRHNDMQLAENKGSN